MIDRTHRLSIARQAKHMGISRSRVYYLPCSVAAADLAVMRRMDELHSVISMGRRITLFFYKKKECCYALQTSDLFYERAEV